jgi:hypothetical protein
MDLLQKFYADLRASAAGRWLLQGALAVMVLLAAVIVLHATFGTTCIAFSGMQSAGCKRNAAIGAGVNVVTMASPRLAITSTTEARPVRVNCPAGTTPVSGGWSLNTHVAVTVNRRFEDAAGVQGWEYKVISTHPAGETRNLVLYANCARTAD